MNNKVDNKYIAAEIFNFKTWINDTDPKTLYKSLTSLLSNSGFSILDFMEHNFPNGGYTCIWLLAESHLAVHTFVDDNKTYIELSGCNAKMTTQFEKDFRIKYINNMISE